jgi:3-deoxy-7-phosphoheptulonate synthase
MDISQIELIGKYCDIFQVGARNMQNFTLLRELGHVRKPVLLKRGISATIEEWLLSAEYILAGWNNDVILCERGHPHVRDRDAEHLRHLRDSRREEAQSLPIVG